jgi:putative membrane protein insertion efficiency factor
MIRKLAILLINFYQKFLTVFSYGSCRYYPTCSEFTKNQFQYNNLLLASFISTKRLLSCNPLFPGGIDYPIISNFKFQFNKKIEKIDFWLVPVKNSPQNNKFYLVRNHSKINIKVISC